MTFDLDRWLESAGWEIPVPGPFDAKRGLLVGSREETTWTEFSPSGHPWLATEFAHVAALAASPSGDALDEATFEATGHALDFVNRYGLTAPWPSIDAIEGPPMEMLVVDLIREAQDLRQVLDGYRDTQGRELQLILESGNDPILRFLRESEALLPLTASAGFHEGKLNPELSMRFLGPIPLLALVKLQLLADLLAKRPVVECQRRGCGKLFIWSRGRSGTPSRTAGLRGPSPQYCSYSHAQAELRDRRQQSEG